MYDFGEWAKIVMTNIPRTKTEKNMIVDKIEKLVSWNSQTYASVATESKMPYFWSAVIEQLRISGYLNIMYVPITNGKDEAILKLTAIGEKWFKSRSNQLQLKAIGLMYAFFKKKSITAIDQSNCSDSNNDSDYESKPYKSSPSDSDFLPGARVVGIDTYYGNIVDDYDPETQTSSEEDDDDESADDGNESDVIIIERNVDDDVICISSDNEDYEPTSKKAKISVR